MSFVRHIFNKELPDQIQIADIQKLIENKTEEFLHLDYEEIPRTNVKYEGLAEHISGFLNTAGGIVVFGVSERKTKGRNIPYKITWTTIKKETLENNLYRKIDPWYEDIQIVPIQNPNDNTERIFVIFVPRSNKPPHMSNYTYYHRLNFQTQPMTHQSVFRVFQTNWFNKRDLYQNVIQPLYSEVSANCERLEKYERGEDSLYQDIMQRDRYLYDLIETPLKEKIEEFYKKMGELNSKSDYMAHKIATRIINEELCKVFDDLKEWIEERMDTDILVASVTLMDISGSTRVINEVILNGALIQRKTITSYLQSKYPNEEVIRFEPVLRYKKIKIPQSTFENLWKNCESKTTRNEAYLSIWRETPELLKLGKDLLSLMLRE